jgi:hypothetical protein
MKLELSRARQEEAGASREVVDGSSKNPVAWLEDPGVSPEDSIVPSKVVGMKRELLRSCSEDPSAFGRTTAVVGSPESGERRNCEAL